MATVRVGYDSVLVCFPEEGAPKWATQRSYEVDDATFERWKRVAAEWDQMQQEVRDLEERPGDFDL